MSYGPANGLRVCPTCKGSGINPVWPTKVCPKCEGETKIPMPMPKPGRRFAA